MANFPEEAQPQSPITGSENLLAAKPAASGAIMIYITPAQLKEYIGTGVPANFFDIGNKVNLAFMPRVGISEIDHEQPVVNGVTGDIQIRRAWLRQFIMDLGAELGWGTETPSTPLGGAAISLGTITENSIGFSWQAVANAASYDIYRGGVKIANVGTTNFNSTGLTASTSYQHYVRAVPASGTNYTTGPASNTLTASTTAATGLPTPTAPTVTFNSSARTLSASHPNYPNGLERSYNGGAWENAADTASVYVGTDAVAANVYEWRVKAVSGTNLAGTPVGNAAISAQVVTPSLNKFGAPATNNTGPAQNPIVVYDPAAPSVYATATAQNILLKFREYTITGQGDDVVIYIEEHGVGAAMDTKESGYKAQPAVIFGRNPVTGKIEAFIGNNGTKLVQDYYQPAKLRMTIRKATHDILFEYAPDGTNYTVGEGQPVPIADGLVLYFRINKDGLNSGDGCTNMLQGGMLIDNGTIS
jgi:hypothetical protein